MNVKRIFTNELDRWHETGFNYNYCINFDVHQNGWSTARKKIDPMKYADSWSSRGHHSTADMNSKVQLRDPRSKYKDMEVVWNSV
jgi:hypothetical protein